MHSPPLPTGLANGVIEEIKDIPVLVSFAADIAMNADTQHELKEGLKQLNSWESVKKVASQVVNDWTDKYTNGGDVAWHQAGKDAVGIYSVGKAAAALVSVFKKGVEKEAGSVAEAVGKVGKGAGELSEGLTGIVKNSYNKLITEGLNAVEQGNIIKLFNSENKLVAEIANNKLVFKYNGYGGDIVMVEGKSTAVFGRFNDEIHGGGTKEFIQNSSKVYETGANQNGINILNINDWTWGKNETWVIESANRGDIIRFISDPTNPINIFKNGISGELTVTGLEVQVLERLGYTWNASIFQFIKP